MLSVSKQTVRRLGCVIVGTIVLTAPARAAGPAVRVEEDWKLVVNEPNNSVNSPQFHTTMSPLSHLDSFYAQVTWNYRWTPNFTPGGLQLHAWDGDTEIRARGVRVTELSTTAETITWTQSLETDGAQLLFQIKNGNSTTWGTFDRDMYINMSANLPDLSSYSPDVSVENSCITYGSNRVNLLVITQVRYYDAAGVLVALDSTPRVVYQPESGATGG